MKKLFVLILSLFLVCGCFAKDNNSAYDALVDATAKAYATGSKVASFIGTKAKNVNDEYEITDNIKKFIEDEGLDKKVEHFGKSVDEFTNDVKSKLKKKINK